MLNADLHETIAGAQTVTGDDAGYLVLVAGQWRAVTPTEVLAAQRAERRRAAAAEHERRRAAGFAYQGKLLQSDAESRENIAQMADLARTLGAQFSMPDGWKAADNTYTDPLDAAGMLALQAAMTIKGLDLWRKLQALKAAIDASPDPASIDLTAEGHWA